MATVMRALTRDITNLIASEDRRLIVTPIEKLARTQALFLYQIIRLFDGDVTLRAQGEKDIPLLQSWLGELCKVRENLGDLAGLDESAKRSQAPEEWEVSSLPLGQFDFNVLLNYSGVPAMDIRRICAKDNSHGLFRPNTIRHDERRRDSRYRYL